jgi:hypothetical protein
MDIHFHKLFTYTQYKFTVAYNKMKLIIREKDQDAIRQKISLHPADIDQPVAFAGSGNCLAYPDAGDLSQWFGQVCGIQSRNPASGDRHGNYNLDICPGSLFSPD